MGSKARNTITAGKELSAHIWMDHIWMDHIWMDLLEYSLDLLDERTPTKVSKFFNLIRRWYSMCGGCQMVPSLKRLIIFSCLILFLKLATPTS